MLRRAVPTTIANTDGGNGPVDPIDNSRADQPIKPVILQQRKDFKFVSKDAETDDNVFGLNEYLYGADARANAGYGFWQFARGSRQPLTPDNYEKARVALMEMKGDYGRPLGIRPDTLLVPPARTRRQQDHQEREGSERRGQRVRGTATVEVIPWLA
ncbi:Mu-like prophage major head subunit gpT family protein [Sphingomonas paucimobilis]|nr:Mu-like prophage major head subunit gpT family protein [Sphingomonas paucimobilis]